MTEGAISAELLVRGAAVGVFVLTAIRIGGGGPTPARVSGAVFTLAAAAHTLTQLPAAWNAMGPAAAAAWVLSVAGAGLFWAFALELFGDNRRLALARFLPAVVLLAIAIVARVYDGAARPLWLVHNLIGAVLMLHVLAVIWTGRRDDLVEARRRLRRPLLGVAAIYTLILAAVQIGELYLGSASSLSFLAAVSLLALSLGSGLVFLRDDPQLLGGRSSAPARRVGARDEPLRQRLMQALDEEEVWREEGLTIGALASRLGAAEHHLRRLINEDLGYRNFAAFLNERRIAAAQVALADPEKSRVAISTVAYDVGFRSLAPFNRAFREITGKTPSDWRRMAR
ncbi:MAG: helix-turn-helix transcriptional regulator [Phenylobacterium sp.]|jgi:AraC-like DNA-binding protein|uniref:helix-turn-helix domain-containing protein n=1 Tax=Phenylobacterium sp. TaxID=1871053 RepID=UPI001A2FD9BF|nr:AraC family transcriptional regulator [Phenylobacterium sp.]MBJ7411022.1 helix-turn-helix transcriptional regulator [Phenylobacterium sp.]